MGSAECKPRVIDKDESETLAKLQTQKAPKQSSPQVATAAELSEALARIYALEARVKSLEADAQSRCETFRVPQVPSELSFTINVDALSAEAEDRREVHVAKKIEPICDAMNTAETVEPVAAGDDQIWRSSMSSEECEKLSAAIAGEHAMNETVWEAALLAFSPGVGTLHSVGIVFVVLLNFLIQLFFCVMIFDGIAKEDAFPSLSAAIKWRETVAHTEAMMDRGSWTSLAEQVCQKDNALPFSDSQVSILDAIDDYLKPSILPGISNGPMLLVLCLILWLLYVAQEFRGSFSFFLAVVNLPRGKTVIAKAGDELEYLSISRSRFFATVFIAFSRHSVSVVLSVAGARWLANTISTSEMLLNAAALAFVLDLDEILFATLLPAGVQALVSKVRPIPRPWVEVRDVDLWPMVVVIWCVSFVSFHLYVGDPLSIDGRVTLLRQVEEVLCGGERNFVLHQSPETNLLITTSTHPYPSPERPAKMGNLPYTSTGESDRFFIRRAVQELAWGNVGITDGFALAKPESVFHQAREDTTHDFPSRGCADMLTAVPKPFLWAALDGLDGRGALNFDAVDTSLVRCEDYLQECGIERNRMIRFLCPITCGCADPLSGLAFDRPQLGCPANVCQAPPTYTASLENATCTDHPAEILRSSQAWARYWESYRAYFALLPEFTANAYEFANRALDVGCTALAEDPYGSVYGVCRGDDPFSSLRAFCPVSCGCLDEMGARCPTQCSANASGVA